MEQLELPFDDECRCCCCTGECRGTADWQIEAEERAASPLWAGLQEPG